MLLEREAVGRVVGERHALHRQPRDLARVQVADVRHGRAVEHQADRVVDPHVDAVGPETGRRQPGRPHRLPAEVDDEVVHGDPGVERVRLGPLVGPDLDGGRPDPGRDRQGTQRLDVGHDDLDRVVLAAFAGVVGVDAQVRHD